jgi:hypothetical protein
VDFRPRLSAGLALSRQFFACHGKRAAHNTRRGGYSQRTLGGQATGDPWSRAYNCHPITMKATIGGTASDIEHSHFIDGRLLLW